MHWQESIEIKNVGFKYKNARGEDEVCALNLFTSVSDANADTWQSDGKKIDSNELTHECVSCRTVALGPGLMTEAAPLCTTSFEFIGK